MVTVNSFCCLRLPTAGVLLGWIGAVFSIVNVITYSILLSSPSFLSNFEDKNSTIPDDATRTVVITVISVYLGINIIDCIASILLIAGTVKERHLLLVPWLINNGLSLVFNFVNIVGSIIFLISQGKDFLTLLLVIVVASIIMGIHLMAWLAIYSLFKLIRTSAEQQRLIPDKSVPAYQSYTRI